MDGLHDDPALALLPPKQLTACVGLLALSESWARRWQTGGFVPRGQVERLGGTKREAALLVSCGLWVEDEHGYRFAARPQPPPEHGESDEDIAHRRELGRDRTQRYRERQRGSSVTSGVTRNTCVVTRNGSGDAGGNAGPAVTSGVTRNEGGQGGSEISGSDLSSLSVTPSPLGSESTQLSGCNAGAREERPNPGRFRFELEETVRAEFFRREATAQKASDKQWRDGCQTVQDALDLGAYPDARAAMLAFAEALVDACAGGEKLGFALQQVQLGAQLRPPVAGGRQLSPLALATLQRRAEGS